MSRYLRHSRALKVCRNREQGQRPRLGLLCSTVGRVSLRALERRQVWLVPVPPPRQPSPTHLSLTPPPEKSLLCSTAESLNVHPRRKGSGNNYHVVTDECTRYKAPGKAQLRSSDPPNTPDSHCHPHFTNHEAKSSRVNAQIHILVSGRAGIQTHIFWFLPRTRDSPCDSNYNLTGSKT